MPFCLTAARRSGPEVRQDSGVSRRPHLFGGASTCPPELSAKADANLGREPRRENEGGWPSLFPLSLKGRGGKKEEHAPHFTKRKKARPSGRAEGQEKTTNPR